jgi:hypothetical protein
MRLRSLPPRTSRLLVWFACTLLIIATAGVVMASDLVILDGDTVKSNGVTYRLVGFDTPERGD